MNNTASRPWVNRMQAAAYREARARVAAMRAEPRYEFRGPQLSIQTDTSAEIVLSGPAGTGKSLAWLAKFHAMAQRYPRSRWLFVRKTRASLTDSALVTFEERILGGSEHPLAVNAQRYTRHSYQYANGSEIVLGGMDRPTRLYSTEFDGVYVQEANELTLGEWESLLRTLRNRRVPFQQLVGDCNPDAPTHWLYQRAQSGGCLMLHTRHEDNPALHNGTDYTEFGRSYIATLDRLTGVRYKRLRLGQWVAAEGTVYEFDRAVHLIDKFTPPADWKRIRAIDFGYTNPFVCLWIAVDPDGRAYVYREYYKTKGLVQDHARIINHYSQGERYEVTVADHDAEDRATLLRYGVFTTAAKKDVRTGIEAVQDRMRVAGDGKPRLFVMRDALVERDDELVEARRPYRIEQEFDVYVYPPGADGKPNKEEPLKDNDHALDALRYGCAYLAKPSIGDYRKIGRQ